MQGDLAEIVLIRSVPLVAGKLRLRKMSGLALGGSRSISSSPLPAAQRLEDCEGVL